MFGIGKKRDAKAPKDRSAALRKEAMENARAARAAIGEDTLERIAAAMTKKQRSQTERARSRIRDRDADLVASELLDMIKDRDGSA